MILVVDDDPDTRHIVRRLLSIQGHAVECAPGGPEAIELLRSVRPGLVILDWAMPRMDGLEVLSAIRSDPRLASVPVVIYSANLDSYKVEVALAAGAAAFIPKDGKSFDDLCRAAKRFDRPSH